MFPYAVGGGTKTDNTYNSEFYATPFEISTNKNGTFSSGSTTTSAINSVFTETQTNDGTQGAEWRFGDGAPVENAWKYSSSYPYAVISALLLSKPGKFARAFADPTALLKTTLGPSLELIKIQEKLGTIKMLINLRFMYLIQIITL